MTTHTRQGGDERPLSFLKVNEPPSKPRRRRVTEIRGPYYTPIGARYLEDILETMGAYVDGLKFAGGSFSLMPRRAVRAMMDLCHQHDVLVSTGGFIEYVLTQGSEAVDRYVGECRDLGFDIIEISSGFITIPAEDWIRLVDKVQKAGLKAKPEIGIQFGAGGASAAAELEAEGSAWYVKNYGPDVNLFVDHSQIVQLECLRAGIWGTKSLWGRVVTYKA
jgi:phosphosulfolactate synthase (CoM biosynthesis protein A)